MQILALDVGTTETGWCLLDYDTLKPLQFGKDDNDTVLRICQEAEYQICAYEEFESFGMPIGRTTLEAVKWTGRMIQKAYDRGVTCYPITRKDEKMNICHSMKANDATIKQALVDRFAFNAPNYGKGTKKNPGWFYGFRADVWSAYAVGVTWSDMHE